LQIIQKHAILRLDYYATTRIQHECLAPEPGVDHGTRLRNLGERRA
jgi:hypothetical protein